jgi:hypothetical protein
LNPADTPLLLIAWRRPHTLRQVIDAIRPVAPTRLFVACDGPNPERPGEAEKVAATRKVIEQAIDWPCQIERLYFDENQGCCLGPSRAISWFFDHVEEGIILEDDCVPHPDFFPYCTSLLYRYRQDTRIWCISGTNFCHENWSGDPSYFFSRIPLIWGWATWRRCWQRYDSILTKWPVAVELGLLSSIFDDSLERAYWQDLWQKTYDNPESITWWDYQWTFTCLVHGGLTTLPSRNLIRNIGFGDEATHTTASGSSLSLDIRHDGIMPMQHPAFMVRDAVVDHFTFYSVFGGNNIKKRASLKHKIMARASWIKSRFARLLLYR